MATGVELATAWVRLVPTMEGAQGEIAKTLGDSGIDDAAAKSGKSSGAKFTKNFKAGLTILSTALVATVGKALSSAISDASDLNEAGTAVGAIFGDSFASIDKWASSANTTLGQSHVEALNAAKSFGVFGAAAGLTETENAKFSTSLAGLASDFASFHNVSPEEAILAIGSGLRGEAEPLRKFGVLLDDASLRAQAMKQGIYDGNGPLTQQQKILAANALIFEQAGAAQGDFAKTADGLANQQRIVDASMKNLSATVGQALLPVMQGLLEIALPIVTWMTENPAIIQAVAIALGILAVAVVAVTAAMWLLSLTPVMLLVIGIAAAVALLIAGLVLLISNWDAVIAWVGDVWAGFVGWITDTLAGLAGWWGEVWANISNFFTTIWTNIVDFFMGLWNGVVKWYTDLVDGIARFLLAAIMKILSFWMSVWNNIVNFFTDLWNGVVSFVSGVFNGIFDTISRVLTWISDAWNGAWQGMIDFITNVFAGIVGVVKTPLNAIIGLVNGAIGALNGIKITIPDWVPLIGGQTWGLSLPKIPMLATGGTVTAAGYTVVGENGPELLKLPTGAQVNPNYDDVPDAKGVTFVNYAPLGQTPAQALTEFSNRAKGL